MKTSPTQRSLKHLRTEGWRCEVVERWNPFAKIRQDLLGFIDILCLDSNTVLAVQTTSDANMSARVDKICSLPAARLWLESPNRKIVVHGWARKGPRGKRKLWCLREKSVTYDMLIDGVNVYDK